MFVKNLLSLMLCLPCLLNKAQAHKTIAHRYRYVLMQGHFLQIECTETCYTLTFQKSRAKRHVSESDAPKGDLPCESCRLGVHAGVCIILSYHLFLRVLYICRQSSEHLFTVY